MRSKKMRPMLLAAALLLPAAFLYSPPPQRSAPPVYESQLGEKLYQHYTITDASGTNELLRVSVPVRVGDEVLAGDNRLYRVFRVKDNQAYARFVRQMRL